MRGFPIRRTILLMFLCAAAVPSFLVRSACAQFIHPAKNDSGQQVSETPSPKSSEAKPDYSREPYVFEQFITQIAFQKDGASREDLHAVVNVLSEAGVQRFGQLVFAYNSSNQKLEVISVEIRKAGSATFSPASAVRDVAPLAAAGAPAYSDYREKHITVPGLRPGDTVSYHIARSTAALAADQFWFEHDFMKDAIVLDEQLEVSVPQNSAIKLKREPGEAPAISEEAERRIYRWKKSHIARNGGVAAKNKSSDSPAPDVRMTTFENWEDVRRYYTRRLGERAVPDAAIRAKAEELVRGKATEMEKIEALYDFVATKIRTLNVPLNLGSSLPHAASETLTNLYGEPRDKDALLAALLEAEGIRSFPALVSSGRDLDADFASPGQLNYLITAIPQGTDGKNWLWLDTAVEVAPFRALAASLRGKLALIVQDSSAAATSEEIAAPLVRTASDPPTVQVQNIDVTGKLDDHDKLTAHIHYSMTGDNALALRMAFRGTPESGWKQLGQLLASGDGFSGEVSGVRSSDPAETHKPFEVDYEISQAGFADGSRQTLQLRLPLPPLGIPEVEEPAEGSAKPLKVGSPLEIHVRARVELPAGYAPRAPVPVSMSRDFATYSSNYTVKANILEAQRDIVYRQREIPEDLVADYRAFTRAARADEAQRVTIERPAAPAAATVHKPKADSSK